MGRKSNISRLPAEIKTYIEAMLATGAQTLDEMIADLRARYPAQAQTDELPSRAALHRYGSKLDRRLAAIKASTEAAIMIRQHAGDKEDARSEALTSLVQTELFEAIMNLQDAEMDDDGKPQDPAKRIGLLSDAAKNIATLTRSSVTLKKFQSEVEETVRKKLLEEQRAALDGMEAQPGVTPETMEEIRRRLGIK